MVIAIVAFVSIIVGAVLPFLFLTKASRQWRELDTIRIENVKANQSLLEAKAELEHRDAEFRAKVTKVTTTIDRERAELDARVISYGELETENALLKQDLRNIDTNLLKLQLDRDVLAETQTQLDERSQELARKYLAETEKWVGATINANNYAACKQRLAKAIEWCREIGFEVPFEREEQLLADLKADYEKAVRAAIEREEQARIKAQIREEQMREREIQRELQALERERAAIKAALDKAIAETKDAHSEEVERLKARLAEAEDRNQRAVSRAQMTKAGHIYVISNIGSFGENVFKIGMTRRLDPQDRVQELSDASVPFPFDVHMMISCDDAPTLENMLHRELHKHRLNKVNLRKEFFRVQLEAIKRFVEDRHGVVEHVADAEALEYRQSLQMSEEDQAYIESVFEKAEQVVGAPDAED